MVVPGEDRKNEAGKYFKKYWFYEYDKKSFYEYDKKQVYSFRMLSEHQQDK